MALISLCDNSMDENEVSESATLVLSNAVNNRKGGFGIARVYGRERLGICMCGV